MNKQRVLNGASMALSLSIAKKHDEAFELVEQILNAEFDQSDRADAVHLMLCAWTDTVLHKTGMPPRNANFAPPKFQFINQDNGLAQPNDMPPDLHFERAYQILMARTRMDIGAYQAVWDDIWASSSGSQEYSAAIGSLVSAVLSMAGGTLCAFLVHGRSPFVRVEPTES